MKKLAVGLCVFIALLCFSVTLYGCGKDDSPVPPGLDITPVEPGEDPGPAPEVTPTPTATPAPSPTVEPSPSPTPGEEEPGSEYPAPCQADFIDCLLRLEEPCSHHKDPQACWDKGTKKCQFHAAKCAGKTE